jgi:hypothetical protein
MLHLKYNNDNLVSTNQNSSFVLRLLQNMGKGTVFYVYASMFRNLEFCQCPPTYLFDRLSVAVVVFLVVVAALVVVAVVVVQTVLEVALQIRLRSNLIVYFGLVFLSSIC